MGKNVHRVHKTNAFTTISNQLFNDSRLSLKAIGLQSCMLSKPDGWIVIIDDVVRSHKDGRDSIYSAIKELISAGYWVKYPIRNGNRIDSWQTEIYEQPVTDPAERIAKKQKYEWGYTVTYEDGHSEDFDLNDELLESEPVSAEPVLPEYSVLPEKAEEEKKTADSVLSEKAEVEKNSADFVLPGFLLPENPKVQQPYINNKKLNNKKLSLTQSIYPSQLVDSTTTSGQTEAERRELEAIFARCDFESGYLEDGEDSLIPFVKNAITQMFYTERLVVGRANYPQEKVRRLLHTVDSEHIFNALDTLRKSQKPVRNPLGYFCSVLYNEIAAGENIYFAINVDGQADCSKESSFTLQDALAGATLTLEKCERQKRGSV